MDKLDAACRASPGHNKFKYDGRVPPVILSAKRFDDMTHRSMKMKRKSRSSSIQWDDQLMMNINEDEESQSSSEDNNLIDNYFANNRESKTEEQIMRDEQEKLEDEMRRKQIKIDDERIQKERIFRAKQILQALKPEHRVLHRARLQSEMTFQRKFNEALNREIAEAAEHDEGLCPEVFIPYRSTTEEEDKAMAEKKRKELHDYYVQELKARREQRLAQKEQEETDIIIERAQYQCLHELEQKGVKEKKKANQEFCKQAFQEGLRQKAKREDHENNCELLDDRRLCVVNVMDRQLHTRAAAMVKKKREDVIQQRAAMATRLGCQLVEQRRKLEEQTSKVEEEHDFKQILDEERRKYLLQMKRGERKAYEREHLLRLEKERKRKAEIHRFDVATRLKNMETNERFQVQAQRRKQLERENLKQILTKQRDEFLDRRDAELVRKLTCDDDAQLHEDMAFFEEGVNLMVQARETGRPMYPIAQAVQEYRKKNEIDFVPEGKGVKRNKLRDYCWPGYHSKADLPYRLYEQRDECRRRNDLKLHKMLQNSIKITQMAAEEKQYKPCVAGGIIKCLQHREVPAIESVDSFDCNFSVPPNSLFTV